MIKLKALLLELRRRRRLSRAASLVRKGQLDVLSPEELAELRRVRL